GCWAASRIFSWKTHRPTRPRRNHTGPSTSQRASMRHSSRVLASLGMTVLLASVAFAQTRIRIGTLAPQGTSYHKALLEMASKWQQATNGRVQVTIYPGTMGGEPELIRRMRLGQLQAAALTTTGVAAIDPGAAALQMMPMVFHDLDEVQYVREKLGPTLAQRLAQHGYVS